jgi:hypothetical protein
LALGRFEHGLARACAADVKGANCWGFIDRQGHWAIPPQFAGLGPVAANGLIAAAVDTENGRLWGYIDRHGQWKIPPRYQEAYPFAQNGLAYAVLEKHAWTAAQAGDNKTGVSRWVLIDSTGTVQAGPQDGGEPQALGGESWESIGYASSGQTANGQDWEETVDNPRWYAFDDGETQRLMLEQLATPQGRIVKLAPYRAVCGETENGLLLIADAENRIGLMRPDGKITVKPRYAWIDAFGRNFLAQGAENMPNDQSRYDVLSPNGQLLAEITSGMNDQDLGNYPGDPSDLPQPAVAMVRFGGSDGKTGLLGSNGLVIPAEYDSLAWDPDSGLILAKKDGREGVLDAQGKPCFFLPPNNTLGSYAGKTGPFVFHDDTSHKSGLVDLHGRILLPARFDDLLWTSLGVGIAGMAHPSTNEPNGMRYGLIDAEGRWIVTPQLSRIFQDSAFFRFSKPGEDEEHPHHIMNAKGQELDLSAYSRYSIIDSHDDPVSPKGHYLIVQAEGKANPNTLRNPQDTLWGLMDEDGRLAIPMSSAMIENVEGSAKLLYMAGKGIVGLDGRLRARTGEIDSLDFAPNGLALAEGPKEAGGKSSYGYLDREGRWTIPPKFQDAETFGADGLAQVQLASGKEAWIDKSGKLAGKPGKIAASLTVSEHYEGTERRFSVVGSNGRVLSADNLWAGRVIGGAVLFDSQPKTIHHWVIGKGGTRLAVAKADKDVPEDSRWLIVTGENGKAGLAGEDAKLALPFAYQKLGYPGAAGFIPARQNGKAGYVSPSGQWQISPQFAAVKAFSADGLAPACGWEKADGSSHCAWGFIDRQGQWKIPPQFGDAQGFAHNGFAPVANYSRPKEQYESSWNAWGLVNEQGKEVVPPIFEDLWQRGNFWVGKRDFSNDQGEWTTYSIIDSQGKTTKSGLAWVGNDPPQANKGWTNFVAADDSHGNLAYEYDSNNGMTDDNGDILVPPRHDFVCPHEKDGLIEAWDNGRVRFLRPDGSAAFTVQGFSYQKVGVGQKILDQALDHLLK